MKPKIFITFLIILLIGTYGCQKDPFSEYNDNGGSHERAITSISAVGQIGVADIERTVDKGVAAIYVIPGTDISSMKMNIEISPLASIDPPSGTVLNLANSDSTATVTVTSQAGEKRDWTIKIKEFQDNLMGSWTIDTMLISWYVGPGEDWGWGGIKGYDKYFPNAQYEYDDVLTFKIEGVRDNGNLYGQIIHDPGPDGEFGEFTLVKQVIPAPPANDYNSKFRTIPVDSGTWERDFANNVLYFNKGEDSESVTEKLEFTENDTRLKLEFVPSGLSTEWNGDEKWRVMEITSTQSFWYDLVKQ